MPSPISPTLHRVIAPHLERAIGAFFALGDWRGLFLSGGTCIAEYYFGHRTSVDMDLFTASPEIFNAARRALSRPDALGFGRLGVARTAPDFSLESLLAKPRHLGL